MSALFVNEMYSGTASL